MQKSAIMKIPATMKDWTVVKGKIFTPKHNFYGLMVVFFDNLQNMVENLSLVFSIYSETHDLHLDESWDKFEKKIQDMIYSGNFSQSISMSTSDKLKDDAKTTSFGSELRADIDKNSLELINGLFKQIMAKTLNDNLVEVDCQFEVISSEELIQGRVREDSSSGGQDEEGIKTPADGHLVNAKLVLAPIDGKLVTDLQEGDLILISFTSTAMTENMLIDKLKLRKPDGTARPAPARVLKLQPLKKGVQVLVHIMDKYYAKITEEQKILVKLFASGKNESKLASSKPGSKSKESGFSWITIGMVIFLGILIAYFVFLRG